jgi:hypothetical protein
MPTISLGRRSPPPSAARVDLVHLSDAWRMMRPADLLLFRGTGAAATSDLIGEAGRGPWSHAALLDYQPPSEVCEPCRCGWRILEVIQHKGYQDTPLPAAVRKHPGRWDVFAADPLHRWSEFNRAATIDRMRQFEGCVYGWGHLFRLALGRVPILGHWFAPSIDDRPHNGHPPFCSEAVSIAYQAGQIDVVPNLADRFTEPADLARSLFFQYRYTLIP